MRSYTYLPFMTLTVLILSFSAEAFSNKAEVDAWLASQGYGEEYELLLWWKERAPLYEDVFVYGCRLAPENSDDAFDVYIDDAGEPLQPSALADLGVLPKVWDYDDADEEGAYSLPMSPAQATLETAPWPDMQDTPRYCLDILDHNRLHEEDASNGSDKSRLRYGVNRPLDAPVALSGGAWNPGALRQLPDGRQQWALALTSPPAMGIRLFVETLRLPENAVLFIVNPDWPEEHFSLTGSMEGHWTPTINNDTALLVCRGARLDGPDEIELRIPNIIHVYQSPFANDKQVGDCHIHVACEPDWLAAASAVGKLGYVTYDAWACTGALIVSPGYIDQAPALPPFLLTANHCINDQLWANSLEVWWFYEQDACENGAPPNPVSLPRSTGGARFLVGASMDGGTDLSLLLLNQTPPAATAYLGFATRPIEIHEPVVSVHHPSGQVKRISFGDISDAGSPREGGRPLAPSAYFHEVLWRDGSTERGSSGAPLILEDTAQIIGHLYGGYASCANMLEPDYYGRLDVGFPLVRPWLYGEYALSEGEGEEPVEGETPREGEGEGKQEGETEGEGEGEGEKEGETPPPGCWERLGLSRKISATDTGMNLLLPPFALAVLGLFFQRRIMG